MYITLIWTVLSIILTFFGLLVRNEVARLLSWILGFVFAVVSGVAWFYPTSITNTGNVVVVEGVQSYGYISLLLAWINIIFILLYYAFPKLAGGGVE